MRDVELKRGVRELMNWSLAYCCYTLTTYFGISLILIALMVNFFEAGQHLSLHIFDACVPTTEPYIVRTIV